MKTLPPRSKVNPADCWDLSTLFNADDQWESAFKKWEAEIDGYTTFAGTLAESADQLAKCLEFDITIDRAGDRLSTYAHLKTAEDVSDSKYQDMMGRLRHAATKASRLASFIRPEIMEIPSATIEQFLADDRLAAHRLTLERILRYKPYTLTKGEEKLLAMQGQMANTANQVFRQLNESDLTFGFVRDEKRKKAELSTSSFSVFLQSTKRSVRKAAFHQFYDEYQAHENTLAATSRRLDPSRRVLRPGPRLRQCPRVGIVRRQRPAFGLRQSDRLRQQASARAASLLRRAAAKNAPLKDSPLRHLRADPRPTSKSRRSWQQAVKLVVDSLEPLGSDYCGTLESGLNDGWCDRYPNKGKQSGGFSSGTYDSAPYILLNYQPDVLDHVFTLAHEAGHSMHTHYSAKHQPYQYYNYTIFVAEVASTFNEQLLGRHMRDRAKSDDERAYLVNREIDAIRGRSTARPCSPSSKRITHAVAEAGEALTVAKFRAIYRELLDKYFGPEFKIDKQLELECFRIPHFYHAFYVYKYSTGLAASIALAERVTDGGDGELGDYLNFLKGGASKWPLDLLRDAGVDMERPEPVDTALAHFERLVEELDELL